MSQFTHKVEVARVSIADHPFADRLDLATIFSFQCAVQKGSFRTGDLVAYVQPDSLVPLDREEFAFLRKGPDQKYERIRAKRLRKVVSQGLVLKAPPGFKEGDDAAEYFGVLHYEPPMTGVPSLQGSRGKMGSSLAIKAPEGVISYKYDLESIYRFREQFIDGEPVIATEKIHGTNARYVFSVKDKKMFVGSKNEWKGRSSSVPGYEFFKHFKKNPWGAIKKLFTPKPESWKVHSDNAWWKALDQNPLIETFCRENPGVVLYGEVFGNVQDMKYGATENDYYFRAFDVLENGEWWEPTRLAAMTMGLIVPSIYEGPFDFELLKTLAEGMSKIPGANHIREGLVVRPLTNRRDHLGRVVLKMVSTAYLERK